jgi:hypothetical protein
MQDSEQYNFVTYKKKKKNNFKNKILCFNMLNNNKCSYENKCMYAHSLQQQYVEPERKKVLNLLKLDNLSGIDLLNNEIITDNFKILTKLCNECINNLCPGGYNCKYGACNKNILICNNDFEKGDCKNFVENFKCINGYHLTLKGLIPLVKQQLIKDYPEEEIIQNIIKFNNNNSTLSSLKTNNMWDEWINKEDQPTVVSGNRYISNIIHLQDN